MQISHKSLSDKIDWITVFIYIALLCIGWFAIYAAEYTDLPGPFFNFSKNYGKQIIWIGVSALIATSIILVDSKLITSIPYVLYGIILVLMIIVAIVAKNVNGAQAWLEIGGVKIQPSEFSKFITALALAKYLSQSNVNFRVLNTKIKTFVLIFIPAIIIILQKDTGSALVYFAFFLVLYREGLPGYILLTGLVVAALVIAALMVNKYVLFGVLTLIIIAIIYPWRRKLKRYKSQITIVLVLYVLSGLFVLFGVDIIMHKVLKPHQTVRINVLLGVEKNKKAVKKIGYNVIQSKIAIGSGGFLGKGYLKGTQTQFKFVPEQSTDFIFCTIGEEGGFIGTTTVLLLFGFLLVRIIMLAERQRSKFSRIYGYCVATILFMHILINVGMTIGLLPVIGIPLPFISYGGSSLFGFTILLFIFIKLDTDRMAVIK